MVVGDVGVVKWWQGRQLRVTRRVVRETHDVIVGLDVAVADGEWGVVVLWRALKIALLFHLSPHGGVPVVLYSVVSPGFHKWHKLNYRSSLKKTKQLQPCQNFFFTIFPTSLSFDSSSFSVKTTKTTFCPHILLFPSFWIKCKNTFCIHTSIFFHVLCAHFIPFLICFFSFNSSFSVLPSLLPSKPQYCTDNQQGLSDSSSFSFFTFLFFFVPSLIYLPGSSLAISAQRFPSFSWAW